MKKLFRSIVLSLTLAAFAAGMCAAQAPGGGGFAQMREKYKYTFQLMQTVRHIGEIDKDPKYTLSPAQAKQVLAVLQPLRSKPKLTQDQAKSALIGLKKIFNVQQLNAMARIKDRRPGGPGGQGRPGGGMGMGGPGGGQGRPGGFGGPGGPGGNRPRFDPNKMKDFNPFYAKVKADDPMAAGRAKRTNEFFASLQSKASGKAGTHAAKPAPKKK